MERQLIQGGQQCDLTGVGVRGSLICLLVPIISGCLFGAAPQQLNGRYIATAYAQRGITASGTYVHRHVVAADPDLLPIGTRLKIRHAGRYSGEYVVADTGAKIAGRRLDIYVPSERACRKFGRRAVKVRVLQFGDGTKEAAKQADEAVKQDVRQELDKKAVGNAATEDDWAVKFTTGKNGPAQNKSAGAKTTPTTATPPR